MALAEILQHHSYALIDRVAIDTLPDELPFVPIIPHGMDSDAHLLPVLVPLYEMDETRLTQSFNPEHYSGRPDYPPLCATFLSCPDSTEFIRGHLTSRLFIKLSLRERALLRYYDPRVFQQMHWILDDAQRAALFGPIVKWTVFHQGQWSSFDRPSTDSKPHWSFTKSTIDILDSVGLINQTLAKLESGDRDHAVLGKLVYRHLTRARQTYRLHAQDQINFAAHALTVHPDFDRHPRMQTLLAGLQREQQSYTDASALLDAADWQQIGAELRQARKQP